MSTARKFATLFLLAGAIVARGSRVSATTIDLYTFESLSDGLITPLTNVAPDAGSAGFLATFTSSPTAGAFQIAAFQPNALFSGNTLYEPSLGLSGNTLTVTLNQAITGISVDFATDGSGALTFASSAGSVTVTSTAMTPFPGGVLTFSSPTPFTSFTLTDGAGVPFAIDNLSLTAAVPEPASMLLLGTGLIGVGARRWRNRRKGA